MHILIIDDNSDDRILLARLIRRDHPEAKLSNVENAEHLACHLAEGQVDLAIIDYELGWGNGLDVFRRIKSAHPDCGAIMYSGVAGEDYAVDAIKAGLDDYIVKDANREPRLRASIHALLTQGEQRHQLRLTRQRYSELFQRVTVGLFACTLDGRFEDANPALLSMLGVSSLSDLDGRRLLDIFDGHDLPRDLPNLPSEGISDRQVRIRRRDGRELVGLLNAYPSHDGEIHIHGVVTNITALQEALDEKSVLLREVYHRVYNNLQLVISLLGLQSRRFEGEEIQAGFRDVMERIRSLALIQQKLYSSEQYSAVDFSAYLVELANSLVPPAKSSDISLIFELDPLVLPIDKAVPLGLMVNELLMNAMKHAFPGERKGEIRIGLARSCEHAKFFISDNGVGARAAANPDREGVGTRLIKQLAQQAGAELTIRYDGGYTAEVVFPHG